MSSLRGPRVPGGQERTADGSDGPAAGGRDGATNDADEASGESLAELIAGLSVGILHFDPGLRLTYANAAAHALLGSASTRPGRTAMETFLDTAVEDQLRAAVDGRASSGELVLHDHGARTVILRTRRARDGGAWVTLEDVTELRRLQQIRTEFVENISHELRTPLSSVSLLAEMLAREAAAGDAVTPRMRERISRIEIETGHLVQMVSELLDLSRIESGRAPSFPDDVDLGLLAESSAERLRPFAERQGVRLTVERAPGLPLVRGDEQRLGQVLSNLLHNAVKFSPDGGPVTVSVRPAAGEVVAAVEDHGIGIRAADRPRIFERFYKVDRARVRGGGTGLGLAIARHIVESHGGRIWVTSRVGLGSTFSFALPAVDAASTTADTAEAGTR